MTRLRAAARPASERPAGKRTRSRQEKGSKAFGENVTSTIWLATEEASGLELNTQRLAATGKITNRPLLVTVLS